MTVSRPWHPHRHGHDGACPSKNILSTASIIRMEGHALARLAYARRRLRRARVGVERKGSRRHRRDEHPAGSNLTRHICRLERPGIAPIAKATD